MGTLRRFFAGDLDSQVTRFCSWLRENPKYLLRNLTAADVKTFFDWLEDNYGQSIKADSTMSNYWRVLVRLHVRETGQTIGESMRKCKKTQSFRALGETRRRS